MHLKLNQEKMMMNLYLIEGVLLLSFGHSLECWLHVKETSLREVWLAMPAISWLKDLLMKKIII